MVRGEPSLRMLTAAGSSSSLPCAVGESDKSRQGCVGGFEAPRGSHRGHNVDLREGGEDADADIAFERQKARLEGISANRYGIDGPRENSNQEHICRIGA